MKSTVETLNMLVETSKDGEIGFRFAADYLREPESRQIFIERADECRTAAAELAALVTRNGGTPEQRGSTSGALHRGWVAVKTKLSSYSERMILDEAERVEDAAMASYRDALEHPLPADVAAVVQRQFEGVKRNHALMRVLRDRARASVA